MKRWIDQILIAFDQFINSIFGGWADETLSSRLYRKRNVNCFWKVSKEFVDFIFFFQKEHCKSSYESEVKRKHFPKELR